MARFLYGGSEAGTTHNIEKKPITYLCWLLFDESIIDSTPYQQLTALGQKITLQLYDTALVDDIYIYEGYKWKVIERIQHPYRPYSKGKKKVSELKLECLGKAGDSDE